MLSPSLRRSALSDSIFALSTWICLSSTLTALICGVTSGWSLILASSDFRSSMVRLVLVIRFWWSSSSVCFSRRFCLMSSICRERQAKWKHYFMLEFSSLFVGFFVLNDQKREFYFWFGEQSYLFVFPIQLILFLFALHGGFLDCCSLKNNPILIIQDIHRLNTDKY